MKLRIAEKIQKYRREMDLTQEELASRVGVTAQAVSGWERDCGYPDITLLPAISRILGITIDELMGNDELAVEEDIARFYETIWTVDAAEKLRMAMEYCRKYPENYDLMDTLIMIIMDWGFSGEEQWRKIAGETAEKIIRRCTDSEIRYNAVECMCKIAEEDDLPRWLDMCPKHYNSVRREVLAERLREQGKAAEAYRQNCENNLAAMLYLIGKDAVHCGDPVKSNAHNAYLRTLIRTFGADGEVPEGWMGKYAFITIRHAAGLFGCGETQQGFAVFREAAEAYGKVFDYQDDVSLSLGNAGYFGGIVLRQHRLTGQHDSFHREDGTPVPMPGQYFQQNPVYLRDILNNWAWFDSVRDDPRFRETVDWAEEMTERFLEEQKKISG